MSNKNKPSMINKIQNRVSDVRGRVKINPRLKIRSYKVQPSAATSISSGALILSIGLITSLSLAVLQVESNVHLTNYQLTLSVSAYEGMAYLLIQFTFGLLLNYQQNGYYLIVGWFLGGFVSSLVHGRKGVKGTYYSTLIAISITMAISLLMGILLLTMNESGFDAELLFFPMIGVFVLSIILTVISIPLIIFAMIGYRLGGYFENE